MGNKDEETVWDVSYVSQCINLHSHLGEGAKDATVGTAAVQSRGQENTALPSKS